MRVWNRKELIDLPEVGLGAIRFFYDTALGRFMAKTILCHRFASNVYGLWQRSALSKGKIRRFMTQYHIDVSDCTKQEFSCFNDFFTRQRRSVGALPQAGVLPAIADSKLLALPISADRRFEIKGVPYTVGELLENETLAQDFEGGFCLIFRLAPEDYHRYAYPDGGSQEETRRIAGVLHTVNPIAADLKVYRRNSRSYTLLHTKQFGTVVQMEVGALLVGRIMNHQEAPCQFSQLQEKGYFAYGGSTVILLLKKAAVQMDEDILCHSAQGIETVVKMGEAIGRIETRDCIV